MRIAKAVITAAGPKQNRLLLQRFVDVDGVEKSALQLIIEEVVAAGVEQIGIVIRPGDSAPYIESAGDYAGMLTFVEQPEPRGYGEALFRAAPFVDGQAFLHLINDHLYVSSVSRRCSEQLVQMASAVEASVSAVQSTRETMLPYYGAIGGRLAAGHTDLYEVEEVREKPTPTEAEQRLVVPGLRASHYLCFFGMHVLTPMIMQILEQQVAEANGESVTLSTALDALARRERYLAMPLDGARYNIGMKYGTLIAQLALTLSGNDREEVLAKLVELLAGRYQGIS
jgi:UTP--glucose-1-phosphate uridylyltransferase